MSPTILSDPDRADESALLGEPPPARLGWLVVVMLTATLTAVSTYQSLRAMKSCVAESPGQTPLCCIPAAAPYNFRGVLGLFLQIPRLVGGGNVVLVNFEVENFRSYREAKRFSMVASSAKELPQNLIDTDLGLKLVRSAVLYGPNASGKSNLLRAMDYVVRLLEFPVNEEAPSGGTRPQFALDRISVKKPSRFRVQFLTEGVLYDYSISVRPQAIVEERLVAYPRGRPQEWFHRRGEEYEFNATHLKGPKKKLLSDIRPKVSLLAAYAANGHDQLSPPYRWLRATYKTVLPILNGASIRRTLRRGSGTSSALCAPGGLPSCAMRIWEFNNSSST